MCGLPPLGKSPVCKSREKLASSEDQPRWPLWRSNLRTRDFPYLPHAWRGGGCCGRDYRQNKCLPRKKTPGPRHRTLERVENLLSRALFAKETRALDQQTSEVDVAGLGDPELRIAVTGLTASRSQAEIAAYITTLLEAFLAA